jgi:hypothetical protein
MIRGVQPGLPGLLPDVLAQRHYLRPLWLATNSHEDAAQDTDNDDATYCTSSEAARFSVFSS